MDDLVKLVSERTGLPPETARVAVDTVLGYLKDRLPAPIASQLDGFLASGGQAGGATNPASALGDLFGKR